MNDRRVTLLDANSHFVIMAALFAVAAVVGFLMLPGENERVAMLERDGSNREALLILEAKYTRGDRSANTLFHLQRLHEHFGDIAKSREILELRAQLRPHDEYVQRNLAHFYKVTQDQPAHLAALRGLLKIRNDFPACAELIGILRRSGRFAEEQQAIEQCHRQGYRRPDDLVRLAFLNAADGNLAKTADLLMAVDNRRRLNGERERLMLFEALLRTNQPNKARRRSVRWLKAAPDDGLALALIGRLTREKNYALAISLAQKVGKPGDSISLTVAETMLNQEKMLAARTFLKGWRKKTTFAEPGTISRFILSALDAADVDLALAGAEKYGVERLVQDDLAVLAEAMRAVGNNVQFDRLEELLEPETLEGRKLLTAAIDLRDGRTSDVLPILQSIKPEQETEWRQVLWHRLKAEVDKALAAKQRSLRLRKRGRKSRNRRRRGGRRR